MNVVRHNNVIINLHDAVIRLVDRFDIGFGDLALLGKGTGRAARGRPCGPEVILLSRRADRDEIRPVCAIVIMRQAIALSLRGLFHGHHPSVGMNVLHGHCRRQAGGATPPLRNGSDFLHAVQMAMRQCERSVIPLPRDPSAGAPCAAASAPRRRCSPSASNGSCGPPPPARWPGCGRGGSGSGSTAA